MSTPLIEMKDAGKHYLDRTFTLSVARSSVTILSGENGIGKTTLIHLMLGYVTSDKGPVRRRAKRIAYVPEHVFLPPYVTALTYMRTLARIKRCPFDPSLLHRFRVPLLKSIRKLSKGNRRKLSIAGAFLCDPELVILDEPLDGLDDEARDTLVTFIGDAVLRGVACVIATHEPSVFNLAEAVHIRL